MSWIQWNWKTSRKCSMGKYKYTYFKYNEVFLNGTPYKEIPLFCEHFLQHCLEIIFFKWQFGGFQIKTFL